MSRNIRTAAILLCLAGLAGTALLFALYKHSSRRPAPARQPADRDEHVLPSGGVARRTEAPGKAPASHAPAGEDPRTAGDVPGVPALAEPPLLTWSFRLTQLLYLKGDVAACAQSLSDDQVSPEQLRDRLVRELDAPLAKTRDLAVKVAMFMPARSMLPVFTKALQDPSPLVRCSALRGIHAMGLQDAALGQELENLLYAEPDEAVRNELCKIYAAYPDTIDPAKAERLCQIMTETSRASFNAGWALCRSAATNEKIEQQLTDMLERGRAGTAEGLPVALLAAGALARRGRADTSIRQILLETLQEQVNRPAGDSTRIKCSCLLGLAALPHDPEILKTVSQTIAYETDALVFQGVRDFCRNRPEDVVVHTCLDRLNQLDTSIRYTVPRLELASNLAAAGLRQGGDELIRIMDGAKQVPVARTMALGALRRATQQDFGYLPFGGKPEERDAALRNWKTHIAEHYAWQTKRTSD
jgi:hypothetical protein